MNMASILIVYKHSESGHFRYFSKFCTDFSQLIFTNHDVSKTCTHTKNGQIINNYINMIIISHLN